MSGRGRQLSFLAGLGEGVLALSLIGTADLVDAAAGWQTLLRSQKS